jgi:hypothetical protein
MNSLIWPGAGIALLGLAGLVYIIARAVQARRAGLDDAEMSARLRKLVALNMAALGISAIGLMMVVIGILLG